jgi:hypothetical protein
MRDVSRRSAAVVVLLGSVVARGDGCSGDAAPGAPGVAQCSGDAAIIGLVPGYCAAIPNCLDGLAYYDMTFTLEPKTAIPDWLEFTTTRGELQDADTSLPNDAFRVCAKRAAMPNEAATVNVDLIARQPSRSREIAQKATILVRSTLPSVVITPREDRSQFLQRSPTDLVLAERAEVTFDVATSYSEANGCEDLEWELTKPAGSVASITCDPARPSVATLRADPADGVVKAYGLTLVMKEPSGLRTRSNSFGMTTRPDDGRPYIEVIPPLQIPPYSEFLVPVECRLGYFGRPCAAEMTDAKCSATAPVVVDLDAQVQPPPVANEGPLGGGTAIGSAACRLIALTRGQPVSLKVAGTVQNQQVSSDWVELVVH